MRALVMAKAPVAGRVKTRLGAEIGMHAAARVAAAALLDTLAACREACDDLHLALDGRLDGCIGERALRRQLAGWTVHPQRGATLGERLARAHRDAAGPGPTVQIGMDTPHVTAAQLRRAAERTGEGQAVLGPAQDGGWWVLALQDPSAASGLAGVRMSCTDTFRRTWEALRGAGHTVHLAETVRDVDTVADAEAVAATQVDGHFRRAWQQVSA
jgi:uncharacterized protein